METKNGDSKTMVSIICLTYNHASYIQECLDGFLMQKTDFPFEVIIHDDASTDGTTDIIRKYAAKYPNIIKPILQKENQYSKHKNFSIIIQNCFNNTLGEYIAYCEGDDYWTDPHKLQKQVDFLDKNPDYSLCYTKVQRFNQITQKYIDIFGGEGETFEQLLNQNTIPTLSVVFRQSIFISYLKEINPQTKNWPMGDYPIWLYVAQKSKIRFINQITGIYRILPSSASHHDDLIKQLKFTLCYFQIAEYFARRYDSIKITKVTELINWVQFKITVYSSTKSIRRTALSVLHKVKRPKYMMYVIFAAIVPLNVAKKLLYTIDHR